MKYSYICRKYQKVRIMAKISINNKRIEQWKADVLQSVEYYNNWFLNFAPQTYVKERLIATKEVEKAFHLTEDLAQISPEVIVSSPSLLHILRMVTAPPIARDRLSGLASISKTIVERLEDGLLPRIDRNLLLESLSKVVSVIDQLLDRQLFEWIEEGRMPTRIERRRAASIIADRLCGADANPIIRNEQECRQINALSAYLDNKNYKRVSASDVEDFREMANGTYCDHLVVLVEDNAGSKQVRIPVDMVVKPHNSLPYEPPVLIECKSAGDFTNTNKRQKEEARKMQQLRDSYGNNLHYILFLCGYFDTPFQGYVASEGIDWVWEHRIEDFDVLL